MKTSRLAQVLVIALVLACSPGAFCAESIGWDELLPPLDRSKNPYTRLPAELTRDFVNLWMVYKRKAAGSSSASLDSLANKSIAALEAEGIDVAALIGDMVEFIELQKANDNKLVEELNGKRISLAGYLLPTEFSGERIVEFLLVPTDGACVHTPVPPRNQLVHVRLAEGIENPGMFTPVQVTGNISTGVTARAVSYSDGEVSVEAGYSMAATAVERYNN